MSAVSNAQASKPFLSAADDLITRLLLDYSIFGESRLGRATGKIEDRRELRMNDGEIETARDLVRRIRKGTITVNDALEDFLALSPVRSFCSRWEEDDGPLIFANHAKRYILALRPESGIAFHETDRYKNPRSGPRGKKRASLPATTSRRDPETFIEVGVFATRNFKKGEVVNLRGGIADLTEEEDDEMRDSGGRRDFSVLWSERKNCFCLLLGPARFVNHDCRNNVEFQLVGANMTFKVLEDIKKDEEIFTHYGEHYFEKDNAACLCATCEQLEQGAFMSTKKKAASTAPKAPATPPTAPSRRSGRAATVAAPNYSEDDPPPGSGLAIAAKRGLRDRGLARSASLSALSKATQLASPRRVRPPSSRVVPVRNAPSPAEALRGKPREVIQPKLPPPPGYASDYVWDSRNRLARYVGPTYSKADVPALKRKGLSRSASAPSSLSALGKRRRDAADSPAPSPKGKGRARDHEDSPRTKRQRSSLVKLKQIRLGERSSTRIAGGSISARERTFAKLQQALGKGEDYEDSDLSELEEEEDAEAADAEAQDSPLMDVEGLEEEKTDDEEVAIQEQLVSPAKGAVVRHEEVSRSDGSSAPLGTLEAASATDTRTTTASAAITLSLDDSALAAPRPDSVEAGITTSTPAEELLWPPLPGLSDADDEDDRIVLCPVPSPLKDSVADRPRLPLATPAQGFYTTAAGTDTNVVSSSSTGPDFRYGHPPADRGGRGADPTGVGGGGVGAGGGVGGSGGDDGEDGRPPKSTLPADKMDVDEGKEEQNEKPSAVGSGKGGAVAPTGEVSAANSPCHAPAAAGSPPETVEDSNDVAAALLLLSALPCAPSALAPLSSASTPPQMETSSSASASSSNAGASTSRVLLDDPPLAKRKKRVSQESKPAILPSLNPRSTRRHSKLPEMKPRLAESPPASLSRAKRNAPRRGTQGPAASTPTSRRTRSQPLPGKLEHVLSAPETLAATGGFDWAKGRYISKHEAVRNPSANPGPPPRPARTPSPSPSPQRKTSFRRARSPRSTSRLTPALSEVDQPRLASPIVAPAGVRATRKSFPMEGVRLAEIVYSREARLAAGGWDPSVGKYVSAAAGVNEAGESGPSSSGSRYRRDAPTPASAVPSPHNQRRTSSSGRHIASASAPPEGTRSTRRSFPMEGVKLADLVYSPAARQALGGWDPVTKRYTPAGSWKPAAAE
ncbi:histone-lysine N-methyltransferase SUV420H [Rhodotorula toruloides]|uniref:Histone-lysine N-methyltransferase SUV420H n=1 Tax=Rhodotorula toruloides TaxID=5286 RepID=A0A511KJ88_RHOTO|nr:histone-lysine N-methyltransferase SUV420H [Rhodotorula toruloides]